MNANRRHNKVSIAERRCKGRKGKNNNFIMRKCVIINEDIVVRSSLKLKYAKSLKTVRKQSFQ